jgi:hypothetical protein
MLAFLLLSPFFLLGANQASGVVDPRTKMSTIELLEMNQSIHILETPSNSCILHEKNQKYMSISMEMEKATIYMWRGRKETVGGTELDGLLPDWVGALLLHASSLDCGSMESQWNDSWVRSP